MAGDWNAQTAIYSAYRDRLEAASDKRRFRIPNLEGPKSFFAIADLDIWGQKTEFSDGVVIIDGVERRYADRDYRLMVEHGIVPKETELIAGVIYWKPGARPPDARTLDHIGGPEPAEKEPETDG